VPQAAFVANLESHLSALPVTDRSPLAIVSRLVEFIVPQLDQLVHALGGIDAVISHVHAAYDRWVTPIDIPGIPNLIEPAVDAAAKNLIGKALRATHDAIHKD
jgi:hypothetical protein